MVVETFRFLGLAFAAADLLFEVDDGGEIAFAAGAGNRLAGRDDRGLVGRPWRELFAEADQALAEALIANLEDGERRGPAAVELAASPGGARLHAMLSVFRLPQIAPRLSCALALASRADSTAPRPEALRDRAEFEKIAKGLIDAARTTGPELEVGLVQFEGLAEERGRLGPDAARALDRRLAGALRAEAYGDAAADLGGERYALIRRKDGAADMVARRLSRVLGAALNPRVHAVAVDASTTSGRMMRALRYALDSFLADGEPPKAATLVDVLGHSVHRTVAEASAFGAVVEQRRFNLVYQPVVSLQDGEPHHHEALVRFEGDASPFATIRMAEELDIIEALDCAVTEEVVKRLRADRTGKLKLAANVSGRTITSPSFMQAVARHALAGGLAGRLMFEITESAAIDDLGVAQNHVQAMQAHGFQVCLDDFGAGAASFAYLQQLSVDIVKIDGAYVRESTRSGRDGAMIRHLVGLCRELKVATVAEMVESQAVEESLRQAGVDYAQGWLYGQPTADPQVSIKPRSPGPAAARRRGAVEQWG
ncbi:MAG TPA: EAL domain-containing protein [Caulobacteraceae bacterium]|nr:EAL domain-containing protein [Caulobacteraceae bacterium]